MNRWIKVLQTSALPLGYAAINCARQFMTKEGTLYYYLLPLSMVNSEKLLRGRSCKEPDEFPQVVDSRPDGKHERDPEEEDAEIMHVYIQIRILHAKKPVVIIVEEQAEDGGYLEDGLELPEVAGGNDDPLRRGEAAQAGDDDLPAEDDQHHPGRHPLKGQHHDQRSHHDHLVCDRIEKFTERGHDLHAAGQVPIQPVGGRCHGKYHRRPESRFP